MVMKKIGIVFCLFWAFNFSAQAQYVNIEGAVKKVIWEVESERVNKLNWYKERFWRCKGVEMTIYSPDSVFDNIEKEDKIYYAYKSREGIELRQILSTEDGRIKKMGPVAFGQRLNEPINDADYVLALRVMNSAILNRGLFRPRFSSDSALKYGDELKESTLIVSEDDIDALEVEKVKKYYDWPFGIKNREYIDSAIVQGKDRCVLYWVRVINVFVDDNVNYNRSTGIQGGKTRTYDLWLIYNARTGRFVSLASGPFSHVPKRITAKKFKNIQKLASTRMSEKRLRGY